jgi:hypothetical protein
MRGVLVPLETPAQFSQNETVSPRSTKPRTDGIIGCRVGLPASHVLAGLVVEVTLSRLLFPFVDPSAQTPVVHYLAKIQTPGNRGAFFAK